MRVTNTTINRKFTTSANDVHSRLMKSFNKVSSGEEYESAAESPLSYYESRRIDNQYQDVLSKLSLIKDVQNRIYQQELGARDIQETLSKAKNQVQYARTSTTTDTALLTLRDDLLQKEHEVVNSLNMQYQNFYVYGGNDLSTPPFSLSADGKELTFTHTFPGEDQATDFVFELKKGSDGTYAFELTGGSGTHDDLLRAMKEQGRIDIGYGDIRDRSTLLDTFTGGLNLLTGITSDSVRTGQVTGNDVIDALSNSPLGLIGQAVQAINDYDAASDADKDTARATLHDVLGKTITSMTTTEHLVSTVYSDLGNKYKLLEDTTDSLNLDKQNLTERYSNVWGSDPYGAIMEVYNNQYAYNAALQVGSNLMTSSLFDFMR